MSVLSEEKVLRINCPGFGVSSILPLGEAKPLAMYEVIVVNPTSVLHLFESSSDLVKQIEVLQSDGMTSYRAEADSVLENISAEFELRAQELGQFLKKGGLLVFFLAPPFTVSTPNQHMDNYTWMAEWCPDRPSGPNQRNMSATIRGKAIEVSGDAASSVWVPYLKQSGLEWSTIVRNDNLTEGFVPLAVAGPNKCIAGFKSSGPRAGQIVFLPAPYAPEYDAKLKECIDKWYCLHTDEASVPTGLQDLSKGLSSLLSDDGDDDDPSPVAKDSKPEPKAEPKQEKQSVAASHTDSKSGDSNGANKDGPPPQFFETPKEAASEIESTPQPDALIKKMHDNLPKANVPEWCQKFSFDDLDGLRRQLEEVNEGIRKARVRADELQERISNMDDLKNALLSADGEALAQAVKRVFTALGWQVKSAIGSTDELWLVEDDKTQAIARLIYSVTQPNRSELAALAESVITYWGAHEVEPKGILVASTYADTPPKERTGDDFGDSMNDFAKRKNLCLLTTSQLLSIYRDLDLGKIEPKEVRENILTTMGQIGQYQLNTKGTTASKR